MDYLVSGTRKRRALTGRAFEKRDLFVNEVQD